MNAQENAFLNDLIKKSYQKQMFYFYLGLITAVPALITMAYIIWEFPFGSKRNWGVLLSALASFFGLFKLFSYFEPDDCNNLPWNVKNRRLQALGEIGELSLEELKKLLQDEKTDLKIYKNLIPIKELMRW